jgi:hypothetical protein
MKQQPKVMTGIIFGQTLHGWDELHRCIYLRQIEDTEMEFLIKN